MTVQEGGDMEDNEGEIQNHFNDSWPIFQRANGEHGKHFRRQVMDAAQLVWSLSDLHLIYGKWRLTELVHGNRQRTLSGQFGIVLSHRRTIALLQSPRRRFWPYYRTMLWFLKQGMGSCGRFKHLVSSGRDDVFICLSLPAAHKAFLKGPWAAVFADITLLRVGSRAINRTHLENGKLNIHKA